MFQYSFPRLTVIPYQTDAWAKNGIPAVSNTHVKDFTAQQRNHKLGDINVLACHCHVLCGLRQTGPYMTGG